MNSIFKVLSNDENIIVASDSSESRLIVWNQSITISCWEEYGDGWQCFSVRTLQRAPLHFHDARIQALRWFRDGIVGDR